MGTSELGRTEQFRFIGSEDAVRAFLAAHPIEGHVDWLDDGRVSFEALVPASSIPDAKRFGLDVEGRGDTLANARRRQREVGDGNRFIAGQVPKGLGIKTPVVKP